ncbi:MAG: DUF5783 family protein [Halobacteriaceae archaeon]
MDHETFEQQKFGELFPQVETAYRRAFNALNEEYDSTVVHAIDQQILDASEPVYEDGHYTVTLPENPVDRVEGVVADDERVEELLEVYVAELESQLEAVLGEKA